MQRVFLGLLKLLSKVFATYLPPTYPYNVAGGNSFVKAMDFDQRVDVLPVSDPNIFSVTNHCKKADGRQIAQILI